MNYFMNSAGKRRPALTGFKTICVIAASLGLTSTIPANAAERGDQFRVNFDFTRTAPVEITYADFRRTAKRACRTNQGGSTLLRALEVQQVCQEDLVERAVLATGLSKLITHHVEVTREKAS